MLQALALAGLSAAGSYLSSTGAGQASAKQGRLQQINDNMARQRNNDIIAEVNAKREALGRELLTIDETTTIEQINHNSGRTGSFVDVDGMMAAAERAGFNPATWLNAGALQAYTHGWSESTDYSRNTTTRSGHNAAEAFKMMLPEYALTQASQAPQQHSPLSALGGALSAGTNAFGQQLRADQSYDLQLARMLAGQAQQGMGLSNGNGFAQVIAPRQASGGSIPGLTGLTTPGEGGSEGTGKVSDLPYPGKWKPGDIEVSNPFFNLFVDRHAPNAEMKSDRYGDVWEEIFGSANMVQDAYRNVAGETTYDTGKKLGINIGSYRKPADTSLSPAFGRWWSDPTSFGGKVRTFLDTSNLPYVDGPRASTHTWSIPSVFKNYPPY